MHRFVLPAAMLVLVSACGKKEEAPPAPSAPAPVAKPAPAPAPEPLIVPAPQAEAKPEQALASKAATIAPTGGSEAGMYTVVKGDTLYRIAKTHCVKVKDLAAWNNIKKASRIRPGQKLRLTGK